MKIKQKKKKDRKMEKMQLIGKHNFMMDNFFASDEDSDDKEVYQSIIDQD